ncbi:hypothetical protein JKJ07_01450 [Actinoplanes sp. LDG1-01]|uniref:Chloramphenicol resistance protein n=1 Tax=Paractinoplanes lichenicola TaxID=2802976 RepID=A0ABS1VE51_9ACTN|nr:MFS transporter [Actinoplanes lichenicola]MBL7252968.1 hypothetical protein [Actinoplanes lichenicola]
MPFALGLSRRLTGANVGPSPEPAESRPPDLAAELRVLRSRQLLLAMLFAALINGGTFAAFTFLAPVATGVAGLGAAWIPVVLVLFGAGSFLGVMIAGRLSDRQPGLVIGVGGPLLAAGWAALALLAAHPVAFLSLVLAQGVLSFAVGSTLITRVLYAATAAPTTGGSYAAAALNIGATAGPALGAAALTTRAGATAPIWIAAELTAVALAARFSPWWTESRCSEPIKRPRR